MPVVTHLAAVYDVARAAFTYEMRIDDRAYELRREGPPPTTEAELERLLEDLRAVAVETWRRTVGHTPPAHMALAPVPEPADWRTESSGLAVPVWTKSTGGVFVPSANVEPEPPEQFVAYESTATIETWPDGIGFYTEDDAPLPQPARLVLRGGAVELHCAAPEWTRSGPDGMRLHWASDRERCRILRDGAFEGHATLVDGLVWLAGRRGPWEAETGDGAVWTFTLEVHGPSGLALSLVACGGAVSEKRGGLNLDVQAVPRGPS